MAETETVERVEIADTASLSDHEATYGDNVSTRQPPSRSVDAPVAPAPAVEPAPDDSLPDDPVERAKAQAKAAEEEARDPNGRFRPRHRAKSQQARAEDVPRIKELTRKLKEAEEQLATERAGKVAPVAAPPSTPAPALAPPPVAAGAQFTEAEPILEQFSDAADPYSAWQRALGRYDRKKEAFEAEQAQQAQRSQFQQAQMRQQWQETVSKVEAQIVAFEQRTPDYRTTIEVLKHEEAPPLMMAALIAGDKYPDEVYALAKNPVLRHEMFLHTHGKPVTDALVASTRRILEARLAAGTTAAAPPPTFAKQPPKPPTAVRTGALQTGTRSPDDAASLSEHEAYFHPRRR